MRCENCGSKIKEGNSFCTRCGKRLDDVEQNETRVKDRQDFSVWLEKYKKHIVLTGIILFAMLYLFSFKCKDALCLLPSTLGGEYCVVHTCDITKCTNKKATDKNYCYTHSPSSSPNLSYTPEDAENVLVVTNAEITHNSSYTVCTATITNKGRKTYTFIQIKGKFKNSSGVVVDTDWTYAVGSEGLAPGESTTLRMSVDKNRDIKKCDFEILDYEKK